MSGGGGSCVSAAVFLLATGVSVLFHVALIWGGAELFAAYHAADRKEREDSSARLDVTSVDLSFSEDERETAPPQTAVEPPPVEPPVPPPVAAPPPEPPPMEDLPDEPQAAVRFARRSEVEPTRLEPAKIDVPDAPPPEPVKPVEERPSPERPRPSSSASAVVAVPRQPAPQQARIAAPPAPRRNIRPKYPEGARRRGEEGDVTLEVSIDETGRVTSVSVVRELSVGFADLHEAAVRAARSARFTPATADGRPVSASARITLAFRLNR